MHTQLNFNIQLKKQFLIIIFHHIYQLNEFFRKNPATLRKINSQRDFIKLRSKNFKLGYIIMRGHQLVFIFVKKILNDLIFFAESEVKGFTEGVFEV